MRSLGLVLTVPVLDGNIAYRRSVFLKMSAGLRRESAENLRRDRKTVGSQQRGETDRVTEDVKALVVASADRTTAPPPEMNFNQLATNIAAGGEEFVPPLLERAQGQHSGIDRIRGKDQERHVACKFDDIVAPFGDNIADEFVMLSHRRE